VTIHNRLFFYLPPLRERKDDVPLLFEFFVKKFAERHKKAVKGFTREARDLLIKYDYPGNVRELENMVERAVVLTRGEYLVREDFPMFAAGERPVADGGMKHVVETTEKKMIPIVNHFSIRGFLFISFPLSPILYQSPPIKEYL
jgi:DNA-binding NtrC family response regulator